MSPKEVWGRYKHAKQLAASRLQQAIHFEVGVDFEDAWEAMEIATLWRLVVVSGTLWQQINQDAWNQMLDGTTGGVMDAVTIEFAHRAVPRVETWMYLSQIQDGHVFGQPRADRVLHLSHIKIV